MAWTFSTFCSAREFRKARRFFPASVRDSETIFPISDLAPGVPTEIAVPAVRFYLGKLHVA